MPNDQVESDQVRNDPVENDQRRNSPNMISEDAKRLLWTFGPVALTAAVLVFVWGIASVVPKTEMLKAANARAQPVEVTVSRDTLSIPEVIPSGSTKTRGVTFKVSNYGDQRHGLAIGAARSSNALRLESTVAAGTSRSLTADLKPGTYIAYCPVEGHQARERADFTVER